MNREVTAHRALVLVATIPIRIEDDPQAGGSREIDEVGSLGWGFGYRQGTM